MKSCAPKIWKKFNDIEKKLWIDFYKTFIFAENFHIDWADKKQKEQREVTAHNMACEAVWIVRDLLMSLSRE